MISYKERHQNLQNAINTALAYANGRWSEWGGRAIIVEDILERAYEYDLALDEYEINTKTTD